VAPETAEALGKINTVYRAAAPRVIRDRGGLAERVHHERFSGLDARARAVLGGARRRSAGCRRSGAVRRLPPFALGCGRRPASARRPWRAAATASTVRRAWRSRSARRSRSRFHRGCGWPSATW
jgi:hypothetical protein